MISRCSLPALRGVGFVAAAIWLAPVGCSARMDPGHTGAGGTSSGGGFTIGGNLTVVQGRCKDGTLHCRKVDCPADSSPSTTSVSGTVYDPAGRVPLYNAVVYVAEEEELKTLNDRAQCEECSAHFPKTATAVALTKADGSFRLTDVPTGEDVPLIVQLGKWRRVVRINVQPCTDTPLPPEKTRLPRNSSEGHIPKIAVTTGGSDALECLLQKIGVDAEEFTPDSGDGRVSLFYGFAASKSMISHGATVPLRAAEELWSDSNRMLDYDMILMSCEGKDNLWNQEPKPLLEGAWGRRTPAMHLEVRKYADLGGRIFGSHWHHRWINSDDTTPDNPYPPAPLPPVATFSKTAKDIGSVEVKVDDTFPKGLALRDWLVNVKASPKPGALSLVKAEHSVDKVTPSVAKRWIYGIDPDGVEDSNRVPEMVQYFSFTTPVGESECGRMVFSDVHVTFGGGELSDDPFPERCKLTPGLELSAQEKALEFMIFDLSSCIQKEDDEISSPITVVK